MAGIVACCQLANDLVRNLSDTIAIIPTFPFSPNPFRAYCRVSLQIEDNTK